MRPTCVECRKPEEACLCSYIENISTQTRFVILMHPKEYKKEKVGTGRVTHLSLKNSEIIVGVDFTEDKRVNELLLSSNCFLLYPGRKSISLSSKDTRDYFDKKDNTIFIIDGTWACAKKMMRKSVNLHNLTRISFDSNIKSKFDIKHQPESYCLSTMESVGEVLKGLKNLNIENIEEKSLKNFTFPLTKLVEFQVQCAKDPNRVSYRKSSYKSPEKRTSSRKWTKYNIFFVD